MKSSCNPDLSKYKFGDKRLLKRFGVIVDAFEAHPSSSIPQACGSSASTKAAYRFFSSSNVSTQEIDNGTYQTTLERTAGFPTILVAQDTTSFNYSQHKKTSGLGPIDPKKTQGALMHSAYAVSPDGLPLGPLDRRLWTRDGKEFGKRKKRRTKKTDEKESQRWIDCEAAIEARISNTSSVVMISDREGDFYDHLARDRRPGVDIIIRAAQNRRIEDETVHTLFEKLEESNPRGTYQVITREVRSGKTRHAMVTYRYTHVVLRPPADRLITHMHPIGIWAIMVREENPPEGVPGLHWKLFTTLKITSDEDALQCINWYSHRWIIERFHYVLKSGCLVEELQLEEAERINKAIALYTVVASRILYMTYLARMNPEQGADAVLTTSEWEALCCRKQKTRTPPKSPPTLRDAILMIAELGGFMGRKRDGMPGVKVIWRGLRRLSDISETYELFTSTLNKKDVGNA